MMVAQSALWVGLLYDDAALTAAAALVARHKWTEFAALRPLVPAQGVRAPWLRGTVRDLAADVVAIARDGLRARARLNAAGQDESVYLAPLEAIVAGGPTQSDTWLSRFHGEWCGDVTRVFTDSAI